MANALETEVTTEAQVASKTSSLQLAIDQVANAVNLYHEIDTAGDNYVLTADDIYRHGIINITGVTVVSKEVTWPTGESRQILVFSDEANTQNIDIAHGTTSVSLEPGLAYWVVSDGTTDNLRVFSISAGGGGGVGSYVDEAGDTMTGSLGIGSGITDHLDGSGTASLLKLRGSGAEIVTGTTQGESTSGWQAERYSNNTSPPTNVFRKARGTIAAPADVIQNDIIMRLNGFARLSGSFVNIGLLDFLSVAATPSTTDRQSRAILSLQPAAGAGASVEVARWDGNGDQTITGTMRIGDGTFTNLDAFGGTVLLKGQNVGGDAAAVVRGDGFSGFYAESYGAAVNPTNIWMRARGTMAAPADVALNDLIMRLNGFARLSGAFSSVARQDINVIDAVPSSTARGARYTLSLGTGSTISEILRADHATGMTLTGALSVSGAISEAGVSLGSKYLGFAGGTLTGPLQVPAGLVSAPGLQIGDADTGFYNDGSRISVTIDGVKLGHVSAGGLTIQSDAAVFFTFSYFGTNALANNLIQFSRSRGTIAVPADIIQNDCLGSMKWFGRGGAGSRNGAEVKVNAIAATPSATDMQSRYELLLSPAGSITPTEILRADHTNGIRTPVNVTLDKAASGDTRYTEFTTGLSGRARVGTFGDDDFRIRVSPDNFATTYHALIIDKDNGFVGLGNLAPTEVFQIYSTFDARLDVISDGQGAVFRATRYANNAGATQYYGRKARGTYSVPLVLANGDDVFSFRAAGYDGAAFVDIARMDITLIQSSPGVGAMGSLFRFYATQTGATGSGTETLRLDPNSGLGYGGANFFLNKDRGVVLRSTTIAGVASLTKTTGTKYWISDYRGGVEAVYDGANMVIPGIQYLQVAASDESTALTIGASKIKFRAPCAMKLSSSALPRASLSTAQTSGSIFTVDINEGATTILSTKLTIDNTESTSTTAATACVISDTSIADDAEMHIDIDQVGDGTAKGLKVTIPYREIVA